MMLDQYAARPIKYFGHDSDASIDIKIRRLLRRFGPAGYGRWWLLCEALASADGHFLPLHTDDDMEIVAEILMFDDTQDAADFVDALRELQLVEPDTEHIWSKRMHKNAMAVGNKRKGGKAGSKKRWGN